MAFEYKVVPAPVKGVKARGVKAGAGRFAHALETVMNDLAADNWEYQRTDTLPCEEREGLMGKTTAFQHMLVFRRAVAVVDSETTQEAFNERVSDALAAPEEPKQIEKQPEVAAPAKAPATALKQPPMLGTPKPPEAPAVPAPAPRPNVAAE